MTDKPKIKSDALYQLLRQEDVKSFNDQRDTLDTSELRNGDYRGRDLRNMNAKGLDFSNAYFRNTDLSGVDFRTTNLEGASLLDAKVSGVYFPDELAPEEIRLSLETGTRLRYRKPG
ncbi:MAG: pentapeptide repeat-containing protein [Pseudomonadota bacterium]